MPTSTPRPAVRACLPGQRLAAQRTRHVCPGAHGGLEAMTFAARNENIFVARALIKHGADPPLPVDGGVPAAFPQDVAFADLMKVPGQGLRRWNECRVRRSCTHVLRSTGQVLTRECADLDASHTKPESDMEKKLKLLRQKVSQDRAKSRGEL